MRRSNRNPLWQAGLIAVGLIIILVSLTFANLRYTQQNPGGNDFLVHWMGTRKLLVDGVSPYSEETALAIQTFAYGRPAEDGEHELRVAYPLYSIGIFLPFALIKDFTIARAIWMTLLEVGLVLLAIISIRLVNWKPKPLLLVFYLIFALLSYHSLRPIINGNVVIIVAVFISGGLLAIKHKADELAGVLLAFSTIKPQLSLLVVIFVVFWAIFQRRHRILIWFFSTLVLLVLSAMLLIPDWIVQNLLEILRYPLYNPPLSLQSALSGLLPGFGARIGWAVSAILVLLLLIEWSISMRTQFSGFLFTAMITLLASQWIGIPTDPGNFIILFPALVMIFEAWERRWKQAGTIYIFLCLLLLFVGIWMIFLQTVEPGYQPQQSPLMFLPFPMFLWIALYWSRWWIIQSSNSLTVEDFEDDDTSMI